MNPGPQKQPSSVAKIEAERRAVLRDLAARKDAVQKTAEELQERALRATDKFIGKMGIGE